MDAEGESPRVEVAAVSTVIVTPSNGDEQCLDRPVETPKVGLGALHVDHSDVDASQSDAPPANTEAGGYDPKEGMEKKKAFPKTLYTLDLSNDYNTVSVPIENVALPLRKCEVSIGQI
jgi:hypothetical protein